MIIIPAIDIFDGKCVRLTQGDFGLSKTYNENPVAVAKEFERLGAQFLHIIDLEGAKERRPMNKEIILAIVKAVQIPVQVGGGIRSYDDAKVYLENGVARIILSSIIIENPKMLEKLVKEFGSSKIVFSLDIRNGQFASAGWKDLEKKSIADILEFIKTIRIKTIIVTDVAKDGMLEGPNLELMKQMLKEKLEIITAGGVSSISDLLELKKIRIKSVIIGKALYEGKIDLQEALNFTKLVSNLTKRIIPCLDVKDGKVVKGVRFRDHAVIGDIVELAKRYSDEGADELVFYDITASTEARTVSIDWVKKVSKVINIPFCVAGGITSVEDARKILQSGADKISINSPALENPDLINNLVKEFGSQAVVVGIDSLKEGDEYFVKQYTGDPDKTQSTKWLTFDWALEAQNRGAGEIVLNCMNQDGTRKGYDIDQLKVLSKLLTIPVVASGGAGSAEDFVKVFQETNVDAGLAASIFHSRKISILDLKNVLKENNIQIRL
jgi:phosphoribosylformimino-5-aminoimidazole carboxamide ribotide isomerase